MITTPRLLSAEAAYADNAHVEPAYPFRDDCSCKENIPVAINSFDPMTSASSISGLSNRFVLSENPLFHQKQQHEYISQHAQTTVTSFQSCIADSKHNSATLLNEVHAHQN